MELIRRIAFSLWYFLRPPWDTGVSPQELMAFILQNPAGRALDLGCGTGTNACTLAKHGWQVVGVDFAPSAIWMARKRARDEALAVDFLVADVTHLNGIQGPFDLIMDIGCFHNLNTKERSAYIMNLDRLLAPTGTFLLYTIIKDYLTGTGPGIEEEVIRNLSNRFESIQREDGWNRGTRPSAWLTFKGKRMEVNQ